MSNKIKENIKLNLYGQEYCHIREVTINNYIYKKVIPNGIDVPYIIEATIEREPNDLTEYIDLHGQDKILSILKDNL